jgi:hypothetical protein
MPKLVLAMLLAGCSTTSVVSSWRGPGLEKLAFNRVVVIASARTEATRRVMEDQMVRRLEVPAVASYTLSPKPPVEDELHEFVMRGQFDGAIVIRVVSVRREAEWVPGTWIGPYYGSYGWGMFDPGHHELETVVRVETNVYALPEEQLIWAATSRTANPASVDHLVDETLEAISRELKRQGLLGPGQFPRS